VLRLESDEDNDEDPVNRGGTSLFCAPFIADVKLIIYLKKYEEKKFVTNFREKSIKPLSAYGNRRAPSIRTTSPLM